MVEKIGLERLIGSQGTRNRDLVLAMIVERLLRPCSKRQPPHACGIRRPWRIALRSAMPRKMNCMPPGRLAIGPPNPDREEIGGAPFGGRRASVVRWASSSYDEGHTCPVARFGHSRDGKRHKPIVVYGVLAPHGRGGRWRQMSIRATRPIPLPEGLRSTS
ncbi:MAG: hypothetical protein ACREVA_06245 [Burkholderiales bacterium]